MDTLNTAARTLAVAALTPSSGPGRVALNLPPSLLDGSSPATRLANAKQRWRAIWTCAVAALVTAVLMPFASVQWPPIAGFLPAYQAALIGAYLITAYLIHGHYIATRSLALLYLSGACVYTGGVLITQLLSFPGMFMAHGALLGGPQSTIWLWCLWHLGPLVGMLLYALTERRQPGYQVSDLARASHRYWQALLVSLGLSIAAVTLFKDWLPVLDVNGDFHAITSKGVGPMLQALIVLALFLLWRGTGFRTVLQLWLGVALVTLLLDNAITMAGGTRLSVGWYVGRVNALVSATVLLVVYLREINRAYLQTMENARQLAASNNKLVMQVDRARLDALTGLPGRAQFLDQAEALRAHSAQAGMAVALLYVDLDGFKQINDQHGHARGDVVLQQTAAALRSVLRDKDVAARLGGDEFVVCIMAPVGSLRSTAIAVATRLVKTIAAIGDGVGCSIGVSLCEADSLEAAMGQADQAMYEAKHGGKNRFAIHGDALLQSAQVLAA